MPTNWVIKLWKNSFVPPASLLSKTSMSPCLALMESAEPYLLFPVITGNSVPDNPLPPAPPQFLRFSLHYVCSENPLFHSAYHHPLYISKRIISGWLVFDNSNVIIMFLYCVWCIYLICEIYSRLDFYHIIFIVFSMVRNVAKNDFNDLLYWIFILIQH